MTTELGKELRKLRIDRNERLLDMAKRIGKSAAFVSAVEVGKKSPPTGFEDAIIKKYGLTDAAASAIQWAANQSRKVFSIEPRTALGRDTAGLLARRMNNLSDDQLEEIKEILKKGVDA